MALLFAKIVARAGVGALLWLALVNHPRIHAAMDPGAPAVEPDAGQGYLPTSLR